jgi:hypothetical protein
MPCCVSARLPQLSMAERSHPLFPAEPRGSSDRFGIFACFEDRDQQCDVRTALALEYASLAELRRQLADGLRHSSPRCCLCW